MKSSAATPAHAIPEEVNHYFAEMGRIAVDLGNAAKDVVQSDDPRKAAQSRHDDDAMDDLHRQLFSLLLDLSAERPAMQHRELVL